MVDLLSDGIAGSADNVFDIWLACLVFEMFSLILRCNRHLGRSEVILAVEASRGHRSSLISLQYSDLLIFTQLLESPIPPSAAAAPARPSQKASSGDIPGTKRGIIDPLVSKRPEKILNTKI